MRPPSRPHPKPPRTRRAVTVETVMRATASGASQLAPIGGKDADDDLADLEAYIAENRKPHRGLDL